jgi:hypothetical protein
MRAAEHLAECVWKHPDNYGGFSPEGDYVVLTRHRDSELLDRVNWDVACESLKAEAYDGERAPRGCQFLNRPNVYHWRAGHWAAGWVEYLMVRADAPADVLEEAGEIVCALAEYPILDESRHSEAEWNAVCEYWEGCSVADRVYELQRAGLCIFAARRDTLPEDPSGALFQQLAQGL